MIYGQMGYNKKACETRQHMLFFCIYFKLCKLQLLLLIQIYGCSIVLQSLIIY
jgi:hypothetical protein